MDPNDQDDYQDPPPKKDEGERKPPAKGDGDYQDAYKDAYGD